MTKAILHKPCRCNDRPDSAALDQVDEALDALHRAQEALQAAKHAVTEAVLDLRKLPDPTERAAIVRWLYWSERQINAHALAAALFLPANHPEPLKVVKSGRTLQNTMRKVVGPSGTCRSREECRRLSSTLMLRLQTVQHEFTRDDEEAQP